MSCNTKAHAVNFKDNQSFDGHNKIHSKPIVIEGENVTLKNIKLKAISNKPQILIKNSRNVTLEDVSITGNPKQNGIHIQDSEGIILKNINVSYAKDGVYLERVNKLRIENLSSQYNRYGIHFMYVTDAILKNSYFSGNITGIMLMVSEQIDIIDNRIEQQRVLNATGITLYQSKGLSLQYNKLLNNYTAASIQMIKESKMIDNTFISNLTGLEIIDSQIPIEENTFTNNINIVRMDKAQTKFQKNHYDDLGIIDLNGDGYGDQPKRFSNLLSELMAQDTTLNFYQNSPLHILLKWIEDKSASLDPGFVDLHPRLEKKQTDVSSLPIFILLGIIIIYLFRKGLAR
ncbi:nitrous oxide reductase family maturation protein NosD [Macrococcus sp. EM39E]|uniref:right-handed parallel beta-helix repeat-containing protein n=1 Tax=Macrococcus animalis TaxID=3395467 RepID=UPI0039BDA48F